MDKITEAIVFLHRFLLVSAHRINILKKKRMIIMSLYVVPSLDPRQVGDRRTGVKE